MRLISTGNASEPAQVAAGDRTSSTPTSSQRAADPRPHRLKRSYVPLSALGLDWNLVNVVGGMARAFVNPAHSIGAGGL